MPKNREQSFEINSFRIIYGTCRPGGQKAGILFSGGYDISSGNGHICCLSGVFGVRLLPALICLLDSMCLFLFVYPMSVVGPASFTLLDGVDPSPLSPPAAAPAVGDGA